MIGTYRRVLELLEPRDRRIWFGLIGMSVVLGLFEAAGVVSILPFLAIASDPGLLTRPGFLRDAYSASGLGSPARFQILLGCVVFATVVGGIAFRTLTLYRQTRFSGDQAARLSIRLFKSYLFRPYVWFLGQSSARMGKGILSEVEQVVSGSIVSSMNLIAHAAVALCILSVLIAVDPGTALLVGGGLAAAYGLILVTMRQRLHRLGQARVAANQARFAIVQEALGGIKEVKLHHLEGAFADRFRAPAEHVAGFRAKITLISEAPRHLLEIIMFGGMIIFVIVVLARHDNDLLAALPVLGLYAFAGVRLIPVLQLLYRSYATLRADGAALAELHGELAGLPPPPETRPAKGLPPLRLNESLELRNASFRFPGGWRDALSHLTLQVPAKSTTGIVGRTGAGKSTLVDVILGLLPLDSGSIRIDGRSLEADDIQRWQATVGYVPQSIHLLDDTIAANIAFGADPERIDMQAVARAAETAELDGFVRTLDEGYDSMVGERGVRLSGGQRQRIGIARALYREPDVLVLDEATSALDTLTERAVLDAVDRLGGEKTILIVAHRLSIMRRCDSLILMENGRILDRGSCDDLRLRNALFAEMHEAGQ